MYTSAARCQNCVSAIAYIHTYIHMYIHIHIYMYTYVYTPLPPDAKAVPRQAQVSGATPLVFGALPAALCPIRVRLRTLPPTPATAT